MRVRNCITLLFFGLASGKLGAKLYTQRQHLCSHINFLTFALIFILSTYYSINIAFDVKSELNELLSGVRGNLWSAKHAIHMCQLVTWFSSPFDKELASTGWGAAGRWETERHLEPGSRHRSGHTSLKGVNQAWPAICHRWHKVKNFANYSSGHSVSHLCSKVREPFYGTILIHASAFQRLASAPQAQDQGKAIRRHSHLR